MKAGESMPEKSHGSEAVSAWVARWAHLVPGCCVAGGRVLDVACGLGRHSHYFLQQNYLVASVDIAQAAIDSIANSLSEEQFANAELVVADIENSPWPFAGRQFAGVVVTNYLWRALLPTIVQSVAPGGVLIYETFATGNETVGKPSRHDFLLQPGELLRACAGLRVVAYEDGFSANPDRFVQRIVAVNEVPTAPNGTPSHQKSPHPASISPARYPL